MTTIWQARHVHFIGIGGIGLSAIARVLLARGIRISGSDAEGSSVTEALQREGVEVHLGHRAENIGDADLVVVTSAVQGPHVEVEAARKRGVRVAKRPEILTELTESYRTIAVAGTHGKTTTTGMIATVLIRAGLDPTVIVGGVLPLLGSNARAGRLPGGAEPAYLVIEADEYDRTFLSLRPHIAVVTNADYDHPDIYPTQKDYFDAFHAFLNLVAQDGLMVVCGESAGARHAGEGIERRRAVYGFGNGCEWRAAEVAANGQGGSTFRITRGEESLGACALAVPGRHNVLNALAAFIVADQTGVSREVALEALGSFQGAARRFEIKGEVRGVTVVDDYAHHPTEIRATLRAARERFAGRTLWAVFQPHTFSRTAALMDEFASAFGDADHVLVTDIYASREHDEGRVHSRDLVARMAHPDAREVGNLERAVAVLEHELRAGDVLVTLGAGDVNRVGARITQDWK